MFLPKEGQLFMKNLFPPPQKKYVMIMGKGKKGREKVFSYFVSNLIKYSPLILIFWLGLTFTFPKYLGGAKLTFLFKG